jgi:hypothetical protein
MQDFYVRNNQCQDLYTTISLHMKKKYDIISLLILVIIKIIYKGELIICMITWHFFHKKK